MRVEPSGRIGGESLPSARPKPRGFSTSGPANVRSCRRSLQRCNATCRGARELRWFYGDHDFAGERDIEFVVSWLVDVDYMIRIDAELGQTAEADAWRAKLAPMRENLRRSGSLRSQGRSSVLLRRSPKALLPRPSRSDDKADYITSTLVLNDLPPDVLARLQSHYRGLHDPNASNAGFVSTPSIPTVDIHGLRPPGPQHAGGPAGSSKPCSAT